MFIFQFAFQKIDEVYVLNRKKKIQKKNISWQNLTLLITEKNN